MASVFRAWRQCRRGKRGTRKAQRYEMGLLDHLVETARMLECGTWRPSRACRFVVRRILFGLLRFRVERDLRRPGHDARYVQRAEAERMLWLARVMLTGNAAQDAHFQGRATDMTCVPPHKQLANAPPETGLPIGNLTSQFFANVYLNELDQFVKHTLKATAYVRYVDDLVLVHERPEQLIEWRARIEAFLQERLRLELRDPGRLAPAGNGVDFLGYIVRPGYRLVRRRVVGHLRERLETHRRALQCAEGLWHLRPEVVAALQASLASYLGHCRHAQSAGLIRSVFAHHPWLDYVLQAVDRDGAITLRRVDRPSGVTSLASQWRYFRRRYPGHMLLLHVGQCLEVWGAQGDGLCLPAGGSPVERPGMGTGLAWPVARGAVLRRALRRRRQPFCQIVEDGYLRGGMKQRSLRWIFTPPASHAAAGVPTASPTISPVFESIRGGS